MKKITVLLVCLVLFTAGATFGQQRAGQAEAAEAERKLARFDLDFPGGTPIQLVTEIQKAMGRPINAIISGQNANRPLPALKMKGVNAAELFRALSLATQHRERQSTGPNSQVFANVSYGFRTTESAPSDDSIWFFVAEGYEDLKFSRFYLLTPYLDAGLTVDDITTAVRTGWKMRGEGNLPALSFHKETKLLIATGEANALSMIDDVLRALDPIKAVATPVTITTKTGEEHKAEH